MNPRTSHIASLVSEKLANGTDYFSALHSLSDELLVSVSFLDECYVSELLDTEPDVPYAEPDETIGGIEYWTDTDVSPLFPSERFYGEEGFVSVGTLTFVIAAFLAIAYLLT